MRGALIVEVAISQVGNLENCTSCEVGQKRHVAPTSLRRLSSRLRLYDATARGERSVNCGGQAGQNHRFQPSGHGGCPARVTEDGDRSGGQGRKKVQGREKSRGSRTAGEEKRRSGLTSGRSLCEEKTDREKGRGYRGLRGLALATGFGQKGRVAISGRRAPIADGQVRKNETNEGRARR